jgi:hypothetical protein
MRTTIRQLPDGSLVTWNGCGKSRSLFERSRVGCNRVQGRRPRREYSVRPSLRAPALMAR